ncbi:hypothetical protein DdX_05719 [Ditylenchus destructor]|uniref:Uncharacterized protein n=1 Tax=Ditylenchus destructor TaxID=166010 RepID=A0AAD4N7R2_9BILA|nr:hypothetical protein DdX_05719 [Ditylenchus destructor]
MSWLYELSFHLCRGWLIESDFFFWTLAALYKTCCRFGEMNGMPEGRFKSSSVIGLPALVGVSHVFGKLFTWILLRTRYDYFKSRVGHGE